jgi:sulfonate transport system ATP-binding protein
MLLVTHDIDEALYLSDRLLILRGQPGEVVEEVIIEQSRPRSRGDQHLAQQKEEILHLLDITRVVNYK